MIRLVLIHSTGQGAAGWERVVAALDRRGCSSAAVDLPNDRPELTTGDYAAFVRQELPGDPGPVVVAHSGSGVLLPAIARALGARRQVWLAAWVPAPGAGFTEDARAHLADAFDPGWVGQDPADDEVAAWHLYHDCDDATLQWALSTRRSFVPLAAFSEQIELASEIPSTYIVATEDRTIRPDWQRHMARDRLGVEPVEIRSGHCPNVSKPDELAELLVAAARV